jgi:hypothetical protein
MKRIFQTIALATALCAFLPAEAQKDNGGETLTKSITYDVCINNFKRYCEFACENQDYHYLDRENILPVYRYAFLNLLFEEAMSGNIPIMDPDNKKISGEDLKQLLTRTDTGRFIRPLPPYDEYDTIVGHLYLPRDVRILRFKEEWTYSPATMEINKKVLAYAPMEDLYNDQGVLAGIRPLFWVNLNKQNPTGNEKLLTQRMISNTSLYFYNGSNCNENKNRDKCSKYLNELLARSYKNEMKMYSSQSDINSGSLIPMTGEELDRSVNRVDTIRLIRPTPPYNDFDSVISEKLDPDSLRVIRFVEEWYIDPGTMYFVKKVIGIALLQEDYDADTGEFMGWRRLFDIYFNDIWQPFDKKVVIEK